MRHVPILVLACCFTLAACAEATPEDLANDPSMVAASALQNQALQSPTATNQQDTADDSNTVRALADFQSSQSTTKSEVVLFGGVDSKGVSLSDTWTFDGSQWTQRKVSGPSARWGASSSGGVNHKVLLFGGVDPVRGILGDTWSWNGTSWTHLAIPGPSPRVLSVLSPMQGHIVLVGGYEGGQETWNWSGTTWTKSTVTAPQVFFDSPAGTLNGVLNVVGDTSSISQWNGTTWTAHTAASHPAFRLGAGAAVRGNTLVMFGGSDTTGRTRYGETWTWDGSRWTQQVGPGPSPRTFPSMATINNQIVLFGGAIDSPGTTTGDTWIFDGSKWTQLHISGPTSRSSATIATR